MACLDCVIRTDTPPPGPPDPGPTWTGVVQEVLDAVPGTHLLLVPLRDAAGRVEDYRIGAASSPARGLVGQRTRAALPATVDSPLWPVLGQVLRDRVPRQAGPIPDLGTLAGSHSDKLHAMAHPPDTAQAWVHPVGTGLLSTWVPEDERADLAERIAHTERLGNLGWAEMDLASGHVVWSEHVYRIFERDPAAGPVPPAEAAARVLPEDRAAHEEMHRRLGRLEPVDTRYRIAIGGRIAHLRVVADVARDAQGQPQKVYAIIQDISAQEANRASLAEAQEQLLAEHRFAAQLQHIILPLPPEPFDLPGLRVAVRYLPAERASSIGGDWYHAATTRDGGVLIAIGDVAGHGLRAARLMAELRHAVTTLTATTTTDPARLLTHLNRLLCTEPMALRTATAVIARYDPPTATLEWAQAGHPAPLHVRDGRTSVLDRPAGPLLGAFPDARYSTARLVLRDGDMLLLYTDGLTEGRPHGRGDGLGPVISTLDRIATRSSRHPLADLLAQLPQANPADDTCILAARPIPVCSAAEQRTVHVSSF